jgi:transcription elongation GreA/GreB family factor
MNFKFKETFLQNILDQLKYNLDSLITIAEKEKSFAISNEMQAEGKYDTRKVEASYLAGAQARRVQELKNNYSLFKNLICEDYSQDEELKVGSLIECIKEENQKYLTCYFFISPGAGGQSFELNNKNVQIVSQSSPIGKALLSANVGEEFELTVKNRKVHYTVSSQS